MTKAIQEIVADLRKADMSGAQVDAGHVADQIELAFTEPVGNAAAMHEALEMIAKVSVPPIRIHVSSPGDGVIIYEPEPESEWLALLRKCVKRANAALSEPQRNCDLARDWLQDLYCKFKPPATVRREMPPEWVDAVMAFCRWLLAPAAERKGE